MATTNLHRYTLTAAKRRVGTAEYLRGASITTPPGSDLDRLLKGDGAWEQSVVAGVNPGAQRRPAAPTGGADVDAAVQQLLHLVDAQTARVRSLSEGARAGYHQRVAQLTDRVGEALAVIARPVLDDAFDGLINALNEIKAEAEIQAAEIEHLTELLSEANAPAGNPDDDDDDDGGGELRGADPAAPEPPSSSESAELAALRSAVADPGQHLLADLVALAEAAGVELKSADKRTRGDLLAAVQRVLDTVDTEAPPSAADLGD